MKRQNAMKIGMITFCWMAIWLAVKGQSITIGGEHGVSIVDTPQVIVKQNARYSLWEGVDVAIKSVIDSGISPSLENVLHELDEMARQNDIKLPYSYSLSGKVSFSTKGNGKTRMEHNNVHRTLTPQNEQRKKDFEARVAARISNILRETSPYAERITARLEREVSQMLAENLNSGSSSSIPDWMPRDTSKDAKQRFGASDFFGRDNRGRSSRYAGGYLSAEFRENFINSRMEGLNPGDAGYDAMRRRAEGAWGQAVKQYDRQFMQFGQEKLKEQSRLDFQQRRETMLKQQEEVRQKQAEEQKKSDEGRQRKLESRGVQGYDPNARPENSSLTNRELEQAAAEAVRNSAMRTGVEARIVIGSGENAIAASGGANGRSTTWVAKNDENAQQFLTSKHGLDLYGGNASIVARTPGAKRGPQVGDSVTPGGGRLAGGGTIVFGDQATFDAAVARNQQKRRVLT